MSVPETLSTRTSLTECVILSAKTRQFAPSAKNFFFNQLHIRSLAPYYASPSLYGAPIRNWAFDTTFRDGK
jgi:hypothetical protein